MNKKTIVITGASDGIGKAAAKELVKLGHEVIIVGRNHQKTKKVVVKPTGKNHNFCLFFAI